MPIFKENEKIEEWYGLKIWQNNNTWWELLNSFSTFSTKKYPNWKEKEIK